MKKKKARKLIKKIERLERILAKNGWHKRRMSLPSSFPSLSFRPPFDKLDDQFTAHFRAILEKNDPLNADIIDDPDRES